MTTNAEKWKQWKLKMKESDGNKHNNNVDVDGVANNGRDKVTQSVALSSDMSYKEKISSDSSALRTADKPYDKTLKMIEDFVKQCKKRSKAAIGSSCPATDDHHHHPLFSTTSKVKISNIEENEEPFHRRQQQERTVQNNQGSTGLEAKQTGKGLQNESKFKRDSNQNYGVSSQRTSSGESQMIYRNKVHKLPAKKVCNRRDQTLSEQRMEGTAEKKRLDIQTKTPTTNEVDRCRRIVQPIRENKKADSRDKDSEEQKSHDDALTKKGQRLMLNYMAEYETSSDSLDDDEGFISKPVTPTVTDVKFIAHLSCTMKSVKPYRSIIFDVIETNIGKAYSPTTGRFKAPISGTYVFFLTVTSSLSEQVDVNIMHNFHPIERTKIKTSTLQDGDMQTRTEAMILTLERKDEIWVLNVTRAPQAKQLEKCHFLTFSASLFKV